MNHDKILAVCAQSKMVPPYCLDWHPRGDFVFGAHLGVRGSGLWPASPI